MKLLKIATIAFAASTFSLATLSAAEAQPRWERGGERPAWGEQGERPARGDRDAQRERTERRAEAGQWGTEAPRVQARGEVAPRGPAEAPGLRGEGEPLLLLAGPYARPFWQNERLAERLQLSDEQIADLKATHESVRSQLEATQREQAAARESLRLALDADSPDLDTVLAAGERLNATRAEHQRLLLTQVVKVKKILTAEQEQALKEAAERLGAMAMRERLGAGRPDGPAAGGERPQPRDGSGAQSRRPR